MHKLSFYGVRALLASGAVLIALSACEKKENRVTFGGYYFRASAKPIERKKTLADFTVTVRNADQSLEGALAAGGYEGTKYCIEKFGTSEINWVVGPGTDPETLVMDKDRITLQGACVPRR